MPCMPASRYNAFRIIIMTSLAYVNAFKVKFSEFRIMAHILENLQFRRQVSMEVSYSELVCLLPTFTFNETQGYGRNSRIRSLYCACAKICARRLLDIPYSGLLEILLLCGGWNHRAGLGTSGDFLL